MILIREEFSAFSISGSDQEDEQDWWNLRAATFIDYFCLCTLLIPVNTFQNKQIFWQKLLWNLKQRKTK